MQSMQQPGIKDGDPQLDVLLLKVPRLDGGVEEVLGQSLFFSISNPFPQIEQRVTVEHLLQR